MISKRLNARQETSYEFGISQRRQLKRNRQIMLFRKYQARNNQPLTLPETKNNTDVQGNNLSLLPAALFKC